MALNAPNPTAPSAATTARHYILGTAGHIDHGKSALVEALTGTHPDRLPEEQKRGMTIELGFAELRAGDVTFGVVDVPGHERFIRTMVAGATGIDLALLVVAGDDSVMPQTREHVEILELLGVRRMVVALSKADLVDADMQGLVADEIRELLAETPFADPTIVSVSALKRTGLDELKTALVAAAEQLPARSGGDRPFRLPVDRVFSIAGRGTVVTGSVLSGRIATGDAIEILPSGLRAKIREVQSHGRPAEFVEAGQRAAINLQGVDKDAIARGDEVAAPGCLAPTRLIDAFVTSLASNRQPVKTNARLRMDLGTREVPVRCVLLSETALTPDGSAYVQLRATEPLVGTLGQRFILRDENAARTVGGGVVLRAAGRRLSPRMADEIAGLKILHLGTPAESLAEVLRTRPFLPHDVTALSIAAGIDRAEVGPLLESLRAAGALVALEGIDTAVSKSFLDGLLERATRWLRSYHAAHPDEPGCVTDAFAGWIDRRSARGVGRVLLGRLVAAGAVKLLGRYVCAKEFAPALSAQDEKVLAAVLGILQATAFQPPSPAELATQASTTAARLEKLLRVATSTGQIVRIDPSIYLHADRELELRAKARELFAKQGPFTVSNLREAVGTSRKYAVPLAEHLDRVGFTKRSGDTRTVVAANES
jgi:selenocysteine-specific elongation factor